MTVQATSLNVKYPDRDVLNYFLESNGVLVANKNSCPDSMFELLLINCSDAETKLQDVTTTSKQDFKFALFSLLYPTVLPKSSITTSVINWRIRITRTYRLPTRHLMKLYKRKCLKEQHFETK